jgi:transposase InsO family protein
MMEKLHHQYPADALAEALQVSESGFAAHRRKAERPRRRRDAELKPLIAQSFETSRRTYGCLRVRLDLQDLGHHCGKNRIVRLMREQCLRPKQKRRFRPRTTDSGHHHKVAENWLSKVPAPDRPGQLWQSDITYLETAEGWLYLAFTLDGCSRRCLAHHCREDLLTELTLATLRSAVQRQRPLAGLIHHSDRGSQYAADAFQQCLSAWQVTSSMSRKGNPYDNALAESFVATLKAECFGDSIPATKAAAKRMVFDYIETFYNRRRRHSALNFLSPLQFEQSLLQKNKSAFEVSVTNRSQN